MRFILDGEDDGAGNVTEGRVAANDDEGKLNAKFVGGFGSRHPGGQNVGFGDGSVRFLKASVSPHVRRLLANRADGELLSSDQY